MQKIKQRGEEKKTFFVQRLGKILTEGNATITNYYKWMK